MKNGTVETHYRVRAIVILDPSKLLQDELFVCGGSIIAILVRHSSFGRFLFFQKVFKVKLEFIPEWQFFLVILRREFRYLRSIAQEFVGENTSLARVLPVDCIIRTSVEHLEMCKKELVEMLKSFAFHESFPSFSIVEEVNVA